MPYATLAEIKTYLGLASVDAGRDTLLTAALDAASARIDRMCGRTFTYAPSATTITYRTAGKTFMNGHGEYGLIVPDIASATGITIASYTFTAGHVGRGQAIGLRRKEASSIEVK